MTKRMRVQSVKTLGAMAVVAQMFVFPGCGGGNTPSTTTGSAGTTGTAGSSSTGGTTGSGGTTGTGGSVGGTTGSAGTTGAGGTAFGQPVCPSSVTKNGTCAPTDVQFCYKTCGPESKGVKSETCQTSGSYTEMSGCSFDPSVDFSCYKIPAAANTACPAGATPQAGQSCDVPMCTLCNSMQGVSGGGYNDSNMQPKTGWCVCTNPASGTRVWSCASNTAWPCPGGQGC
jgi:hypothetical protein